MSIMLNYGRKIKALGRQKAHLSTTKKAKQKNKGRIDKFTAEIKLLQKYRNRRALIPDGVKTIGEGIYTQKKRNAYKINNGQYGGLTIDLPKLFGQLKLVAHKNGQKVYDKQVDFDTLDLLTKRFNSKKKYSNLAKMVLDDLNRLSEIPIHRTSKKYKKIGCGVMYYNNPQDLMDRLELLGGSILAGNDGLKDEFTQIAHTLNKLGILTMDQLNNLIKEYVIY